VRLVLAPSVLLVCARCKPYRLYQLQRMFTVEWDEWLVVFHGVAGNMKICVSEIRRRTTVVGEQSTKQRQKVTEVWKNYVIRSFVVCTLHLILLR
jgi:hypothetical protein